MKLTRPKYLLYRNLGWLLLFGLGTETSMPNGQFYEPLLSILCLYLLGRAVQFWSKIRVYQAAATGMLTGLVASFFTYDFCFTGLVNLSGSDDWPVYTAFAGLLLIQAVPILVLAVATAWFVRLTGKESLPLVGAAFYTLCFHLIWQPIPTITIGPLVEYPLLMQTARLGGLSLTSFIYAYFCFSLAAMNGRPFKLGLHQQASAVLLLSALLYGGWFLQDFAAERNQASAERLKRIAYIQPNVTRKQRADYKRSIAQAEAKGLSMPANDLYEQFFTESLKLHQNHGPLDLIVWAEAVVPYEYFNNKEKFSALQQKTKAPLFANTTGKLFNGEEFNSSLLLGSDGSLKGYYTKRNLLPFIAYIPFIESMPYLKALFPFASNYQPGKKKPVLKVNGDWQLAPAICFDSLFANHVRDFVEIGANIMIEQSNDGAFERGGALAHKLYAAGRAIEFNIPALRITNSGIGVHVRANGVSLSGEETPLNQAASGVYEVYIPKERSFYTYAGDWMLWVSGLILLYSLSYSVFLRRKKKSSR